MHYTDVGDSEDYKLLMAQFHKVISEFKKLKKPYQLAIKDITMKMGKGMNDFAEKMGVDSLEEWDLYRKNLDTEVSRLVVERAVSIATCNLTFQPPTSNAHLNSTLQIRYCHYVAGLVGHGLSALFSGSQIEKKELASELEISNSMGML